MKNLFLRALNFSVFKKYLNAGASFVMALSLLACSNDNKFDAMGIFESDEIIVSSEISGKIIDLNLSEGEILEQNQFVGLIDTTQLELNLAALKEQIKALNAKK